MSAYEEASFPRPPSDNKLLEAAVAYLLADPKLELARPGLFYSRYHIASNIFTRADPIELDEYFKILDSNQFERLLVQGYQKPQGYTRALEDEVFILGSIGERSRYKKAVLDDILTVPNRGTGGIHQISAIKYITLIEQMCQWVDPSSKEYKIYRHTIDVLKTSLAFGMSLGNVSLRAKATAERVTEVLKGTKDGMVELRVANAGEGTEKHLQDTSRAKHELATAKIYRIDSARLKTDDFWKAMYGNPGIISFYETLERFEKGASESLEAITWPSDLIFFVTSKHHTMALQMLPGELDIKDLFSTDQAFGNCHVRSIHEAVRALLFFHLGRAGYKKFRELFKRQIAFHYARLLKAKPWLAEMVLDSHKRATFRTRAALEDISDRETAARAQFIISSFLGEADEKERARLVSEFVDYLNGTRNEEEKNYLFRKIPTDIEALKAWLLDSRRNEKDRRKIAMYVLEFFEDPPEFGSEPLLGASTPVGGSGIR